MIQQFDHWIAFVLLVLIGLSMIKESREEAENLNDSFQLYDDAAARGGDEHRRAGGGRNVCVFAGQNRTAISFIGATTFILSAIGTSHRQTFSAQSINRKQSFVGGIVLILMGVKILLEHLGVLDMIFG